MAFSQSKVATVLRYLYKWLARNLGWIAHPIAVFVCLILIISTTISMWVVYFVDANSELAQLASQVGAASTATSLTLMIIGCVLLGFALFGIISLFVFGQRQRSLAKQQRSFVSSVTHELRSPLSSIQLTFETLRDRDVDKATREKMMDMLKMDIYRLHRLVDQILLSSRLDRGIKILHDEGETVTLSEVIDQVCDTAYRLDERLINRFKITCEKELTIEASKPAITLIVGNLIENAVKYSPESSDIVVEAKTTDKEILLKVNDKGFGLDQKEKKRIFKMFHRADIAMQKAIPGTGLGLFNVNTVVKGLGGKVWAESEGRDHGATFFVSLPLKNA